MSLIAISMFVLLRLNAGLLSFFFIDFASASKKKTKKRTIIAFFEKANRLLDNEIAVFCIAVLIPSELQRLLKRLNSLSNGTSNCWANVSYILENRSS